MFPYSPLYFARLLFSSPSQSLSLLFLSSCVAFLRCQAASFRSLVHTFVTGIFYSLPHPLIFPPPASFPDCLFPSSHLPFIFLWLHYQVLTALLFLFSFSLLSLSLAAYAFRPYYFRFRFRTTLAYIYMYI